MAQALEITLSLTQLSISGTFGKRQLWLLWFTSDLLAGIVDLVNNTHILKK